MLVEFPCGRAWEIPTADTRLKLLSKWDPTRYGDKLEVEKPEVTLQVVIGGTTI
jgi:hypothetical protein